MESEQFWKTKDLNKMTKKEWESLCDGCGRCCLNKVEYTDTKEIFYTNAACKLLDLETCQCSNYPNRLDFVSDCIVLNSRKVKMMKYLPDTCAYRLLAEGKNLPKWHPLITGNVNSVHEAGISVSGRAVSEDSIQSLEDHIIRWIKPVYLKKTPKRKS